MAGTEPGSLNLPSRARLDKGLGLPQGQGPALTQG